MGDNEEQHLKRPKTAVILQYRSLIIVETTHLDETYPTKKQSSKSAKAFTRSLLSLKRLASSPNSIQNIVHLDEGYRLKKKIVQFGQAVTKSLIIAQDPALSPTKNMANDSP
jgi:hypothetical protein